jgi:site-specific DNA recombinase
MLSSGVFILPADFPRDLNKVAMYLRKSRADFEAESRGEGDTLSKHRKALTELAQRNRLNVVSIFEEIVSGEHISDRPEMQRLLHEVEAGEYDAVLCMDLDRLGRGDMIDQGTILAAFKASSTLIITPRKVYDLDDELDEEWSEFEAFMARRELKIINKRLQRGRVMAVKDGKYIGTRPPFGYDRGPDKVLIPNKDAEIVRLIYNWYVNGNDGNPIGSTRIANRLNEMKVKSPVRGGVWEPSVVRFILSNEVYIGRIQWKKKYRDRSRKIGYARPREQWIDVEGKHEPLIEKDIFYAAQNNLKKNTVVRTKTKPKNPLAGLIVCGKCERRMVLQSNKQKSGHKSNMCKCIHAGCDNKSSLFSFVEKRLLQTLEEELANLELNQEQLAREIAATAEPLIPNSVIENLTRQLEELQKQKSRLQDLLEQGVYDIPTYLERNKIVTERIEAASKSLQQVQDEINEIEERERTHQQIIPTIRHVLDAYQATDDVVKKNTLLKTIVDKAVYYKEKSARLDNFTLNVYLLI